MIMYCSQRQLFLRLKYKTISILLNSHILLMKSELHIPPELYIIISVLEWQLCLAVVIHQQHMIV
jgi:hypothetical protein